MIGTERLRDWVGTLRLSGLVWAEEMADELESTVDQIERERAEDCYRMGLDYGTVWCVVADMERHCLGHEGMEDSPVARWARELRGALKSDASDGSEAQNPSCADAVETADVTSEARKVTRGPAEDVSMSAYDLLSADERNALAWVRDHGGIDYVKREWRSRVPYDRYVRRRQRLLGHIAECETALGRRREIISKLTHRVSGLTAENAELRKRAMPEGMEWLRYDTGEPVPIGGEVTVTVHDEDGDFDRTFAIRSIKYKESGVLLEGTKNEMVILSYGERVKRPSVPAADGEPLEVGQTVWDTNGDELVVGALEDGGHTVTCRYADVGDGIPVHGMWSPSDLTHQRPALDADGVPIKKGDTVWGTENGRKFKVLYVAHDPKDGFEGLASHTVLTKETDRLGLKGWSNPKTLTHTKPEPPDSRRAIVNEVGDEMAARIDLLVSSGRWSDAD